MSIEHNLNPGMQFTKNGMTLTIDFIDTNQVFYMKHRESQNSQPESLDDDWNRFIGLYRVPVQTFLQQVTSL